MQIKMILTNAFDPDPRVYKEAKALISSGHDVEILCWDRDNRYFDRQAEVYSGIKIKRFYPKSAYGSGLKQMYSYWLFIREIKRYLKNGKYDVVHAHDIDGAFAATFVKGNAKLLWDMHEVYDGFNYGVLKSTIYEMIAKRCFRKSDGLIYVSNSQKERYKFKKKEGTSSVVIMNAPEETVFSKMDKIPSEKLRISFIGSVREYAVLKRLMDAGEKFSDVIINLNGMGVAYKELKNLEHKYSNTNVTGQFQYKDIGKYYQNTDIIYAVYDSEQLNSKDAFPVKGLEAIATQTPIIASENTLFGKFVNDNGIGFTIDEKSDQDIESLLKSLLFNKHLITEKKENISKIKDDFKWSEQVEKLIGFYIKVTSKEIG